VTASPQALQRAPGRLPETGLADLVRVATALQPSAAALHMAAELLGIAQMAQPDGAVAQEHAAADVASDALRSPAPASPAIPDAPAERPVNSRLALPATVSYLPPRPFTPPEITRSLGDLLPPGRPPKPLQSLFPPERGRALLVAVATQRRPEGDVDTERTVEILARGEPLAEIPRQWVDTSRGGLELALDIGQGMEPYSSDVDRLPEQMRSIAGVDGLMLRWFEDCPVGGAGVLVPGELSPVRYHLPPVGTLIVVVTTFGARGSQPPDPLVLRRWHEFRRATTQGGIPLVALTPLPVHRRPSGLPSQLAIVTWDRTARVQHTTNTTRVAACVRPDMLRRSHRS